MMEPNNSNQRIEQQLQMLDEMPRQKVPAGFTDRAVERFRKEQTAKTGSSKIISFFNQRVLRVAALMTIVALNTAVLAITISSGDQSAANQPETSWILEEYNLSTSTYDFLR